MSSGTLFVVATPIGNLKDITLRALEVLGAVSVIAAEDTRVTGKLLGRHDIATRCVSFREQNAARAIPRLIARLEAGEDLALATDAGTPGISDPGQQLVEAACERGIAVSPIPGASALAAALSVAALHGDGARFVGFLPRRGKRRRERIAALAVDPACTVLYEAPSRLAATLGDLAAACGAERKAAVLRELTKVHEEVARGSLAELAERFGGTVRGEITLVVAGSGILDEGALTDDRLRELIRQELKAGQSARDLAAALARTLGIPRKRVYDLAVSVKSGAAPGRDA
jgi:16S rRNA (cytidine1402-2'-O)-methyltransferase